MRTETNQLVGNQEIHDTLNLEGQLIGNVTVAEGGKILVKGQITGSLAVLAGGKAEIWGMIKGSASCEDGGEIIYHPESMVAGKAHQS